MNSKIFGSVKFLLMKMFNFQSGPLVGDKRSLDDVSSSKGDAPSESKKSKSSDSKKVSALN